MLKIKEERPWKSLMDAQFARIATALSADFMRGADVLRHAVFACAGHAA